MKDFFITILAALAVYVIADGVISVVAFALHPAGQSTNESVSCAIGRNHAATFCDNDNNDNNDNS